MIHFRKFVALSLMAAMLLTFSGTLAQAVGAPAEGLTLLPPQLQRFNGKDGQPAYIAVDGILYDVTAHPAWQEGKHKGIEAGADLTAQFAESPHEAAILEGVPQVGTLLLFLTLSELEAFNGKDGQPAYIAVDGIIYDASNNPAWNEGMHNGFEAGKDVTESIKNTAPHGVKVLEKIPKVGQVKLEMTLEQLGEFNGKDGKPAYIAVDGIIYDESNSPAWTDGMHNGFEAGKDVSEEIKAIAPHGVKVLENLQIVGVIVP